MSKRNIRIRQARIDVPLQSAKAYLFVTPDEVNWHPWWLTLYNYLNALAPSEPYWEFEPVQHVYIMRAELTDAQRAELVAFLRSAPVREIETHRTLRRAVDLTPEDVDKVDVMYFSGEIDPKAEEANAEET